MRQEQARLQEGRKRVEEKKQEGELVRLRQPLNRTRLKRAVQFGGFCVMCGQWAKTDGLCGRHLDVGWEML